METISLPVFDYTQENGPAHPCPPTLSSFDTDWDKLHLALFSVPPRMVPVHCSRHHSICINYGNRLSMQAVVDGKSKSFDLAPGAIGIFPADIWQTFEWYQDAVFLDLYLDPDLLNQVGADLCEDDCIELVPNIGSCFDPLIYQIALALKTALEVDSSGSKLYADSMANALAVHLIARYSTHQPAIAKYLGGLSKQKLRQVLDYIHEHLDENLSLNELAKVVHLSPYHFTRLFKQSTGMSPHQYHIQCRIEQAKQLLAAKNLSLAEIAQTVGFTNQGHLNYHFKKFTGVTPKVFLKRC